MNPYQISILCDLGSVLCLGVFLFSLTLTDNPDAGLVARVMPVISFASILALQALSFYVLVAGLA